MWFVSVVFSVVGLCDVSMLYRHRYGPYWHQELLHTFLDRAYSGIFMVLLFETRRSTQDVRSYPSSFSVLVVSLFHVPFSWTSI